MPRAYEATTQTTGRVVVGGSTTVGIEVSGGHAWFAVELMEPGESTYELLVEELM